MRACALLGTTQVPTDSGRRATERGQEKGPAATVTEAAGGDVVQTGDELWYDEILEETDDWFVVRVRTPDGRDVEYRIMTTPLVEAAG